MSSFDKWVACWGNATSITDRTICTYAKDITLRYPVKMCFDGDKLRFRFSNLTGTEEVAFYASVARSSEESSIVEGSSVKVLFGGEELIKILPGKEVESDPVDFVVKRGEFISVSIYLPSYTQMNAGVLITGPLSKGFYCYGRYEESGEFPIELMRKTNWFYFLNTIDVRTESSKRALICYGDSITAQAWPDYLTERCFEEGYGNVSIIRRAVSGTRILRQYDCITYAAYGLKGETRFPLESDVSGAEAVIIQHGINDIIHPVGVEENPFRPWEDLPTAEEMIEGIRDLYIRCARDKGLKVYGGTLLPIYGWRTYADFREKLKNDLNDWIRTSDEFDGVVDFDAALRDDEDMRRFKEGFDSGDHLHPSMKAYKAMAYAVPAGLLE